MAAESILILVDDRAESMTVSCAVVHSPGMIKAGLMIWCAPAGLCVFTAESLLNE